MITEPMTLEMVEDIAERIEYRQRTFDGEDFVMSVGVVLMNYGEGRRIAHCIRGDWSGPKSTMGTTAGGLPACPVCGAVATQDEHGWRLALVEESQR